MHHTYVTEAVSSSVGTITRKMTDPSGTTAWNAPSIFNRSALWLPALTTNERKEIAKYQKNQAGEPYVFSAYPSEKERTNRWHCSKLQWRAYKEATGIDIDCDGGWVVFPNDIVNHPSIVGISF